MKWKCGPRIVPILIIHFLLQLERLAAKKRAASESEEDTPLLQRKTSKKKVKKGLYYSFEFQ